MSRKEPMRYNMNKITKTKVYIPNKGSGHDYSDAALYGDLVFVTEGLINSFDTGIISRHWKAALEHSRPDDYIVVTSLHTLCMIGAALFAAKHGRLNLLLFSSSGKYQKRELVIRREGNEIL
jgi:hypothetical protein